MYLRLAEVIQTNMQGLTDDDDYSMENAILYFQLEAELRVEPLMMALPLFSAGTGTMSSSTDWCTYQISITRGYS